MDTFAVFESSLPSASYKSREHVPKCPGLLLPLHHDPPLSSPSAGLTSIFNPRLSSFPPRANFTVSSHSSPTSAPQASTPTLTSPLSAPPTHSNPRIRSREGEREDKIERLNGAPLEPTPLIALPDSDSSLSPRRKRARTSSPSKDEPLFTMPLSIDGDPTSIAGPSSPSASVSALNGTTSRISRRTDALEYVENKLAFKPLWEGSDIDRREFVRLTLQALGDVGYS